MGSDVIVKIGVVDTLGLLYIHTIELPGLTAMYVADVL